MPRPGSIRFANMLLYVQLALSVAILATNIRPLVAPTAKEAAQIGQLTAAQIALNLIILAIPAVAAFAALWAVRRKKRMAAIVASAVLLFAGSMVAQLFLVLAAVTAFLMFSRPAKAYFSDGLPQPGPAVVPATEETSGDEPAERAQAVAAPGTEPAAPRIRKDPEVEIRPAGPDDADTVHALMMEAFEEYRAAVPPSSALDETVASVRADLEAGQGAAILYEDGHPSAMVRYAVDGNAICFFRLSVRPSRRRRGCAKRLVRYVEQLAVSKGLDVCRCKVRQTVQNNVAMYQDMGYEIVDQELVVRPGGSVKALTMEKKLGV